VAKEEVGGRNNQEGDGKGIELKGRKVPTVCQVSH
jgi:hypothetical protein